MDELQENTIPMDDQLDRKKGHFDKDTEWWETEIMVQPGALHQSHRTTHGDDELTTPQLSVDIEHKTLVDSVEWLGNHLCLSVLNRLASEVQEARTNTVSIQSTTLPFVPGIHNQIDFDTSRRAPYQGGVVDRQAPVSPDMTRRRGSMAASWAPIQDTPQVQPTDTFNHMKRPSRRRQVSTPSRTCEARSQPDCERLPMIRGQHIGNSLGNGWRPSQQLLASVRAEATSYSQDVARVACNSDGIACITSAPSLEFQMRDLTVLKESKYDRPTRRKDSFEIVTANAVTGEQSLDDPPERATTDSSLPYTTKHRSALLFIDISGFTALSQMLSPDLLSKTINAYFQLIVNEVISFKGDILKFAGDALFAAWYASDDEDEGLTFSNGHMCGNPQAVALEYKKASLADCVAIAAMCGANIVAKLSDFAVHGPTGVQVASLNVRCGLGAGNLECIHVGDNDSLREYLFIGDPIQQVSKAETHSVPGEMMASPEALHLLMKRCRVCNGLSTTSDDNPVLLARKSMSRFLPLSHIVYDRPVTHNWKEWDRDSLVKYHKLISLYVHHVALENTKSLFDNRTSRAESRHSQEAELRSVYVMFINMPDVMVTHAGDKPNDQILFRTLNDIMRLTKRELDAFSGHFRQFIIDDKGLVLIATFGLRGSTVPNMVADRALPATCKIHEALHSELGIRSVIGATIGNAYCGVVGGIERHEYAVLGPAVNRAARLMASPFNPGILVDEAVRLATGSRYRFNALDPIEAKGYHAPVPIFEPLSSSETRRKRITKTFVGRQSEIQQLSSLAKDIVFFGSAAKLAFVSGPSGKEKTTLVAHAIAHIRQVMGRNQKQVLVTNHMCKNGDQNIPVCMFRTVLVDVLAAEQSRYDDKSKVLVANSRSLLLVDSIVDPDWDSIPEVPIDLYVTTGIPAASHQFLSICGKVGVPRGVVHSIGHHLLGMNLGTKYAKDQPSQNSACPIMQTTIEFVVRICQKCTESVDLVLIAVDDAHHLDEVSWMILQRLLETDGKFMIVCTSVPSPKHSIKIPSAFEAQLFGKYSRQGRFVSISLNRLSTDEMRSLVSKHLGCGEHEICSTFLDDIFTQSGGMPYFANEILEWGVRRKYVGKRLTNGCVGWEERMSVEELIIHRLDSYEANVRYILSICAVIGNSFQSKEIVAILEQTSDLGSAPSLPSLRPLVLESLEFLVAEGVLSDVRKVGLHANLFGDHNDVIPDSKPASLENRSYSFCHDIWTSTILSSMLDDRIRGIHQAIALTLEGQQELRFDYMSQFRLFGHWKASGESSKAATLALSIGKSFEEMGLCTSSIKIYEDALDMWRQPGDGDLATATGIPRNVLDTIDTAAVENIILLYVALGKCCANQSDAVLCQGAYRNALETFNVLRLQSNFRISQSSFPS